MSPETKKATLEVLAMFMVIGGVTLAAANPVAIAPAILLAGYFKKENLDKKKFSDTFRYLKKQKYISVASSKGKTIIKLTKKGREKAAMYHLERELKDKRENLKETWDHTWYLVMFDIRHDRRIKRDALRSVLLRSGFVLFQKSIWIYPFDCRSEIKFVKDFFSISDKECRVVVSRDIGDDKALRKQFGL